MIATKPIPFVSQKDKDRFWGQVDKTSSPVGCWLWTGSAFISKYGRFVIRTVTFRAHRISFILSGGEFSNGPLVLHGCRNKNCVNPSHLYSGTEKQNQADCVRDGTARRGEAINTSKLTEALVRKMRTMRSEQGLSWAELGRKFGVTYQTAGNICKRKIWKHVD